MTRTRLDSEERRRAIVEAALPLFARKGFAGATTKAIARAAGVSEALVFQHFPSKAALYREILAQGCAGDPDLGPFDGLEPSTITLGRMVRRLLGCFVLGEDGDPVERDTRHRLLVNSFLDDGEYARLVQEWVVRHIHPPFLASMREAERAGDLRPGVRWSADDSWFAQHVAANIAYGYLPGRSVFPYEASSREEVAAAAFRFILRGLGLTDEAIARIEADPDPSPPVREGGPAAAAA